jgi:hypothetical protein
MIKKLTPEEEVKKFLEQEIRTENIRRGIIVEMSTSRSEFMGDSVGLVSQMFYHVLLLSYCISTGRTNSFKHWKDEVVVWTSDMASVKLKDVSKGNHYRVKNKAMNQLYRMADLYDFERLKILWEKAISKKEKILYEFDEDMYEIYKNIMEVLLEYISESNVEKISQYVNNLKVNNKNGIRSL